MIRFSYRRIVSLFILPFVLVSLSCKLVQGRTHQPTAPGITAAIAATTAAPAIAQPGPTNTTIPLTLVSPSLPAPTSTSTPLPPTPTLPGPTLTFTPRPTASEIQLRAFEELWQTVKDAYLYPDYNGLDWNAIYNEYLQKIESGLSDEDYYQAMHEMISRLGDEHSTYFNPQEAAEEDQEFEGNYDYAGIGVLTQVVSGTQTLVIILVFADSPAEKAGLKMHDGILAIDGEPPVKEGVRQNLLRGPEGTTINVTVQTPGKAPRQVAVTRQRISSQLPTPYYVFTSPAGKRVGYILLPTFNDSNVAIRVGEALQTMNAEAPLDGLVLDVRENGGGVSTVVIDTLSYFTQGTVGYFVERNQREPLRVRRQDIGNSQRVPLVVLVGDGSASFGEVFPGLLKDLGRAYLIGEQTDGNVEVLSVFDFSDGSRAWIATATFSPVNQTSQNWEETGIVPDWSVPTRWNEITLDNDPAIQAALQYFDGQASTPAP